MYFRGPCQDTGGLFTLMQMYAHRYDTDYLQSNSTIIKLRNHDGIILKSKLQKLSGCIEVPTIVV